MKFRGWWRQAARWTLVASLVICSFASPAEAHFPWLVVDDEKQDQPRVRLYFSELAEPDNPELLKYLRAPRIRMITPGAPPVGLRARLDETSWVADVDARHTATSLYVTQHDFGVLKRGGAAFMLKYYAKTGPPWGAESWKQAGGGKLLDLELVPQADEQNVRVTVFWKQHPVGGAELTIIGPGDVDMETVTDKEGAVTFAPAAPGLYSIRARHIEATSGDLGENPYDSIRHYSTLALRMPAAGKSISDISAEESVKQFPDLPQPLTSFGGAVTEDCLYVYGGHQGEPHSYSTSVQSDVLWKLNIQDPRRWQSVAKGPRLQGLALVAHEGKLYRIGGFTAKNDTGEDHDLWSQDSVACFDPHTQRWTDLPPLPEPRSSLDAAVIEGKIYVVGGWQLRGAEDPHWHETAWMLDLAARPREWKPLAAPPCIRRALALAALGGKLYAIGGMRQDGGTTTRVDVYDPVTSRWSDAPAIPGEGIEGFGCAAFANGGQLYVSTVEGNLQRITEGGQAWKTVQKLKNGRFFHRMLPLSSGRFVMIGGANFSTGKVPQTEVIHVVD